MVHTIDNRYVFPDTEINLDKNYIIGHSHCQFKMEGNGYTLYNTGSVGQNRGYINQVNYIVHDTREDAFELRSTICEPDLLIAEMKTRKFPAACIEYYKSKKRI